MTTVFVQFTDAAQTKISAVFGCAQNSDDVPNQGVIDDTDARYQAFIAPAPDPAARLAAIDNESVRPLRAITAGTATDEDHAKLTELDAEAVAIRAG